MDSPEKSFPENEPDEPKRKSPTGKIALLAGICVVVLGFSIWGLVASALPGNAAQAAAEQPAAGLTGSTGSTGTAGSTGSAGAATSSAAASTDANSTSQNDAAGSGSSGNSGSSGSTTTSVTVDTGNAADTGAAQGQGGNTPADQGASTAPQAINVVLSVNCSVAVDAGSATAQAVSDNGAMRYASLRLNAGSTVYDALVASGAALGSQGSALGVYIASIDGLSQGEAGPQSGWKYYVNGTAPGLSCDRYVLSNGDSIEWRYVVNANS